MYGGTENKCNVNEHLCITLQDIYSEALSVLAYMMLNVITNECITSLSKTRL